MEYHYESGGHACVVVWKEDAVNTTEYYSTPETLLPAELAYGVLRVRDAPSVRHQTAVGAFFTALRAHVLGRALGSVWVAPLDVVLDEPRALVVQPDLLYVSNERRRIVHGRVHGAPDLVVEVLSPRARVGDHERRLGWFAEYGVHECWLYHQPDERLEVVGFAGGGVVSRRWIERDDSIDSRCLPAFSSTLAEVVDG